MKNNTTLNGMKMEFNVGDKVRVKKNAECDNCRGKTFTITKIIKGNIYPIVTDLPSHEIFDEHCLVLASKTRQTRIE